MKKQPKISLNIGKGIDFVLSSFSPFERKVLKATSAIRFGQVRTYSWIAKYINCPQAQRAVGQTLKKNPFPFLIPCHRVIRSDGKIGGYSLGVGLKKQLLVFEKELVSQKIDKRKKTHNRKIFRGAEKNFSAAKNKKILSTKN